MKIWQLNFEVDKYDNIIPISELSADEIQSFDGRSKKNTWRPLLVKRMEPEKGLEISDAPGFIIPVFSKKALEVLFPIVKKSVEVLELKFSEKELWGINVISILDVIDYSKAKYKTFSDGKRIMAFQKYAFRMCDELLSNDIFKIVEEKRRRVFVSDRFKEMVEKNNLSGFRFILVWDSEQEKNKIINATKNTIHTK